MGGDTLFANQYIAYEALSQGMKAVLDGLVAVHANGRILRTLSEAEPPPPGSESASAAWSDMSAKHPVVRTHPETGRKALYVNELHTERFKEMTVVESQPLLQFLYRHSARPDITCRFRWKVGSVAFWYNRCAIHLALNDYQGHHRLMHRVQVKGARPVSPLISKTSSIVFDPRLLQQPGRQRRAGDNQRRRSGSARHRGHYGNFEQRAALQSRPHTGAYGKPSRR